MVWEALKERGGEAVRREDSVLVSGRVARASLGVERKGPVEEKPEQR